MLIDIVILPPEKLRRRIGERIKKSAKGVPAGFIVDNKKFIPHLSLWHLKTSANRLNKMAAELEKLVKKQKPIAIRSSKFNLAKMKIGVVADISVSMSKPLSVLQNKVFRKIYRFKAGMMPPFKPFGVPTGKGLKEARKYGRAIWFYPHFTAAWVKNMKDAEKIKKGMKNFKPSFTANEIYICRVNRWWQVDKIIKKINFGNDR